MDPAGKTVILSRALILLIGLVVWALYYLDARLAYRMPRGPKRTVSQVSCVVGSVGAFALQVQLMEHFAPNDAQGSFFFGFILVEAGGAMAVLFATLVREKHRSEHADSPRGG